MDLPTQRDYISWRAPELARSGHFRHWTEIVRQLRCEGAYGAHMEIRSDYQRQKLNRLCDAARQERLESEMTNDA